MTKQQAIKRLTETRDISTAMLKPLGISMDSFLWLAQLSDERQRTITDKLIVNLTAKGVA